MTASDKNPDCTISLPAGAPERRKGRTPPPQLKSFASGRGPFLDFKPVRPPRHFSFPLVFRFRRLNSVPYLEGDLKVLILSYHFFQNSFCLFILIHQDGHYHSWFPVGVSESTSVLCMSDITDRLLLLCCYSDEGKGTIHTWRYQSHITHIDTRPRSRPIPPIYLSNTMIDLPGVQESLPTSSAPRPRSAPEPLAATTLVTPSVRVP